MFIFSFLGSSSTVLTRSHIAVPGQKKKRSTDHLEISSGREYAKFAYIVHTIIPTKRVLKKRTQTKIAFAMILGLCFRRQILVSFKMLRPCLWKSKLNESFLVFQSFGLTTGQRELLKFLNQLQHAITCPLQ